MPTAQISNNSVFSLIADSGLMAKLVLLLLVAASVFCWSIIFAKRRALKRASAQNQKFLSLFWQGKNYDEVFGKIEQFPNSPIAAMFKSGVKELNRLPLPGKKATTSSLERLDNIQRSLMRASANEISNLEKNVGWLATTASAAPFVGLFGTVWGIMNSFQSIGVAGGANLAVVAPGISEALITTATGIAAAIPAVVAYNHFAGQIKKIAVEMECFSQDFMNITQRNMFGSQREGD